MPLSLSSSGFPLVLSKIAPLQILMAEDNPLNHRIAQYMLAKLGHDVTLVINGHKVIEALERQPFDLVLMDIQMPEMDGLQATLAIRAAEALTGRHIPIIALTACVYDDDRARCLKAGMDDYLCKPIQSEKLQEAIQRCLSSIREEDVIEPSENLSNRPIDLAAALDRLDGDQAFLRQIVAMFLEESPKLMAQIRDGIAGRDAASLDVPVHNLKNWVGHLIATAILAVLDRLESSSRTGNLLEAENTFNELEREFERLLQALVEFGKDPSDSPVASLAGGDTRWSSACIL
jgi:two-component system sensor histidine kinase/response regulator